MRFEIGPGGMIVILLGLLGLSGAVFGLGLIAGHELAGPEPGAPPVAAAYPLPGGPESPVVSTAAKAPASAPVANASNDTSTDVSTAPASETAGADTAAAAVKPASAPAASLAKPIKGPVAARKLSATGATVASKGSHSRAAADEDEDLAPGSAVAPPSSGSAASTDSANTSTGDETEDDSAPAAPVAPVRKRLASANSASSASAGVHPYSIQIDAMMDYQGAQQMEQKLRAKGFQPYMVPTQLGGKTWYRLRVGHYTTPEDAQAAEAKLHQEFK